MPGFVCMCVCTGLWSTVNHFTSSLSDSSLFLLIHTYTHFESAAVTCLDSLNWRWITRKQKATQPVPLRVLPQTFRRLSCRAASSPCVLCCYLWGLYKPGRHTVIDRRARTSAPVIPLSRDCWCRSAPRCAKGSQRPYRLTRSRESLRSKVPIGG